MEVKDLGRVEGLSAYEVWLSKGHIGTEEEYLASLKGADGQNGQDGQDGQDGAKGDTGNGIQSITKTGTEGLVDTYTILFTDGTSTTFTVTNGESGGGTWGSIQGTLTDQQDLVQYISTQINNAVGNIETALQTIRGTAE